jgi:hypothetical protein
MKRSIVLTLSDEELIELERIILDDDEEAALCFLQKHFKNKARATLDGESHCKPYFEMPGRRSIPDQFKNRVDT